MEAVRVPPSAWSTSQSSMTVRSPRTFISTTERMERPMSRWISCVRPEGRPLLTSRGVRLEVARGSIEYSAVTQPLPELRRKGGTVSSTEAAHKTCVFPTLIRAEPSAVTKYPVMISTGRRSADSRLSVRIVFHHEVHKEHDEQHAGDYQDHAGNRSLRRPDGLPFPAPHR